MELQTPVQIPLEMIALDQLIGSWRSLDEHGLMCSPVPWPACRFCCPDGSNVATPSWCGHLWHKPDCRLGSVTAAENNLLAFVQGLSPNGLQTHFKRAQDLAKKIVSFAEDEMVEPLLLNPLAGPRRERQLEQIAELYQAIEQYHRYFE